MPRSLDKTTSQQGHKKNKLWPGKKQLQSAMPSQLLLGQRVVHNKTGIEGVVTEKNKVDGKVKVRPTNGKAFNFQKPENFTLKSEWQGGGSVSTFRKPVSMPSATLPRQPVEETFVVGRTVAPLHQHATANNVLPTQCPFEPLAPLRSFRVDGQYDSACVTFRSSSSVQEPVRPTVTQQPIVRRDELWLKKEQQLRDMLPDDIPEEFQHCVAPHYLQMEPSWRINWRKKSRERAAQVAADDNAPKRRIVVQKKVWGPNEARSLSAGEFEIDYVTRYVRIHS